MTRTGKIFVSGRERGFTLLELLVATAVGAVVLLVINATFFSALRLHDATNAAIETDLVLQRTLGIVRKDLAGLMLPAATQTATTLAGPLQTESISTTSLDNMGAERITPDFFTSSGRIDGWTSFSEVQIVSYHLLPATDGGSTKNLVRVVTRNLLSAQQTVTTDDQTLLPGVMAAGISFYDGDGWVDYWDSTASSTLPTAIKFRLTLAPRDGDTMRTPAPVELIVPVLVTTVTSQQEAAAAATGQ